MVLGSELLVNKVTGREAGANSIVEREVPWGWARITGKPDEDYRVSGQYLDASSKLVRKFKFADFLEVFAFIAKVALLSEKRKHHPDITFGYNYANVELTTHAAGRRLMPVDYKLALEINHMLGEEK